MDKSKLIEVKNLKVYFETKSSLLDDLLGKGKKVLKAVDGVSFEIYKGEVLSLVGESGSGKTTTGKAILQLVTPTAGEILFRDEKIIPTDKVYMKKFRQNAQMIYQDPYQSVNPRNIVLDIVAEPIDVNHLVNNDKDRLESVCKALEEAGIVPAEEYLYRYPHELSGGQRQRVVIASSMIMKPDFVVADEPVSMLDASIRTGILRLMLDLRDEKQLSYLFITHDLSLAWLISDRIAIMYLGKIMEIGSADILIKRGMHPYTKALTAIMPIPGKKREKAREILSGETPNPIEEIIGCKFASRCPEVQERCGNEEPEMIEREPGHFVACHFAQNVKINLKRRS